MTPRKDNRSAPPSPPGEPAKASKIFSATSLPSPPQELSRSPETNLPLRPRPSPIELPDKEEREGYYYGLPSEPALVARSSSDRWVLPLGPYSRPEPKQLKNIGNHPLASLLPSIKDDVMKILDTYSILWTTIEAFRIGFQGQKDMPVVLWIGALEKGLIGRDGASYPFAGIAVMACKKLLEKNHILDVHCELKLSKAYRVTSPPLLKPSTYITPVVDVEVYLTPTIGTCIGRADLYCEGTFGFYVKFPEHGNKVFGVTCRHVFFPEFDPDNKLYHHNNTSQPRRSVLLPGNRYLGMMRERAVNGAQDQQLIIDKYKRDLSALAGQEGRDAERSKKEVQHLIDKANEIMKDFEQLVKDLDTQWKTPGSRNVGHVVFSPPISTGNGPNEFTMDWALYEVDPAKIKNFSGNVIDLGQEVSVEKLNKALNPNIQNAHKFVYPAGRQWKIENICIPLDEMRHPKKFDQNNSPALSVLKRGRTTGVTCGVANEVESYVRTYSSANSSFKSKEWAILGYDKSFYSFSCRGDSGALVVDAEGRMGGMVTGGSGFSEKTDVTYATPMVALLQDIHKHGWKWPNLNVAP